MDLIGVVVWDGRKNGPGSAYLVADPEPPAQAPPKRVTLSERILTVLAQRGPMTTKELGAEFGASVDGLRSVMWLLVDTGRIEVVGQRNVTAHGRTFGRRFERVYGLVTRPAA